MTKACHLLRPRLAIYCDQAWSSMITRDYTFIYIRGTFLLYKMIILIFPPHVVCDELGLDTQLVKHLNQLAVERFVGTDGF